jgi:hypothetical protein
MKRFINKLGLLLGRKRFANELDEEMAFHREQTERDLVEDGIEPESAHHAAMRRFGNSTRIRERSQQIALAAVSQRTREIGVRMALGAQRSSVYSLLVGEAARLIAAGIVLGLASAVGAAWLMRKLLFGVQAWDLSTLVAVAVLLAGSALLASYFPARRAASVNPTHALRAD